MHKHFNSHLLGNHSVARQCVHCCKGDISGQWEIAIFGHLGLRNPWTDQVKIWHDWLRPAHDPTCQNWDMPLKGYRVGVGVKLPGRVLFLVPWERKGKGKSEHGFV